MGSRATKRTDRKPNGSPTNRRQSAGPKGPPSPILCIGCDLSAAGHAGYVLMFGPRTIGGVINYITADPPQQPETNVTLRGGSGGFLGTQLGYGNT